MPQILRSPSFFRLALSLVLASSLLPASAQDAQAARYPLNGKVLSTSPKGWHVYQVDTDSRIYLMMCEKAKDFHLGPPECKSGDKRIDTGDTVPFRVDGDTAFTQDAKGGEDALRILSTELKAIPPLPPSATAGSGVRGMVIGIGFHVKGQNGGWSTNPSAARPITGPVMAGPGSPVIASGPIMATPVTGGPPVMVMPTGPVGGGVVTGVPVTGGPPIVAMPTAPVMGMPVGGAPMAGARPGGGGGAPPPWVHVLRVQAGGKLYQLECSHDAFEMDKKKVDLGDTLTLRFEKKWAYVSSGQSGGEKEQKLRILSETDENPLDKK